MSHESQPPSENMQQWLKQRLIETGIAEKLVAFARVGSKYMGENASPEDCEYVLQKAPSLAGGWQLMGQVIYEGGKIPTVSGFHFSTDTGVSERWAKVGLTEEDVDQLVRILGDMEESN